MFLGTVPMKTVCLVHKMFLFRNKLLLVWTNNFGFGPQLAMLRDTTSGTMLGGVSPSMYLTVYLHSAGDTTWPPCRKHVFQTFELFPGSPKCYFKMLHLVYLDFKSMLLVQGYIGGSALALPMQGSWVNPWHHHKTKQNKSIFWN